MVGCADVTGQQLLIVVAILTGPSYGVIVLGVMAWLWKRNRQPDIHVHYEQRPDNPTGNRP